MATIAGIYAREILDSRGIPTIECTIWLDTGHQVTADAASGTSKGKYEAIELRDNNKAWMNGLGVQTAINNINTIIGPQLIGKDPTQQTELDQLLVNLDGTPNKSKLGSNTLIAVSTAIMKAGAAASNLPVYSYVFQKYQLTPELIIPSCIYTMMNGGEHGADNLDIQEFQLIPASHFNFIESLNMAVTLFAKLEEVLILKGAVHSVGLVGGFTPNLFNNTDAFEIIIEAIKASPYTFAQDVFFGADISASSFYESGKYTLKDKSQPYSSNDLLDYYKVLRNNFHVFYIEDPFEDEDWKSWTRITEEIGSTSMIAADSALSGSVERTAKAISQKICNTAVIKPNQLGTISETIQQFHMVKEAGMQTVISHRSGDTNDTFIADFAVGLGSNYIRFGPPNRGERVAKYNRLMEIYYQIEQMKNQAQPDQPAQAPAPVAAPAPVQG
jgi:enolase